MFLVGNDLNTLADPQANFVARGLAFVDLASNVALIVPFEGEVDRVEIKSLAEAGERGAESCSFCFPARTLVATPHGKKAIDELRVGERVLSENPATRKVEAEPVLAVLKDPVSPLVAVHLSDGSAITVTANHPFWVDGGVKIRKPGWVQAGQLRPGDRLRAGSGADVSVRGVRYNVGHAVVYTLTVAHDHTFFVGAAAVLVHNAVGCSSRTLGRRLAKLIGSRPGQSAAHHLVADGDPRALGAVAILQRWGITDLNGVVNGVFLPRNLQAANASGKAVHSIIHTDAYYLAVEQRLSKATSQADCIRLLRSIAVDLLHNRFPY